MTTLLLLPSMLHYNKRKRRGRWQQSCRCLLRCTPTKETKEGDGKIAVVTFCAVAKKKKECNGNVVTVTFFAMLQQEKIKNATTTLLPSPSSSHCSKRKRKTQRQQRWCRLLHCNKIKGPLVGWNSILQTCAQFWKPQLWGLIWEQGLNEIKHFHPVQASSIHGGAFLSANSVWP